MGWQVAPCLGARHPRGVFAARRDRARAWSFEPALCRQNSKPRCWASGDTGSRRRISRSLTVSSPRESGSRAATPRTLRTIPYDDGHTEVVRVIFDLTIITYETVLREFWYLSGSRAKKPRRAARYKSAVWTRTSAQEKYANASKMEMESTLGGDTPVVTSRFLRFDDTGGTGNETLRKSSAWHDAPEKHRKNYIAKPETPRKRNARRILGHGSTTGPNAARLLRRRTALYVQLVWLVHISRLSRPNSTNHESAPST